MYLLGFDFIYIKKLCNKLIPETEVIISRKQMVCLPCFILNNFYKDLLRDYKMINVSYTETHSLT